MGKDHAIMLLGEAIHIVENWTAYGRQLTHLCNLLREAKGNLETAPVQVAVSDAAVSAVVGAVLEGIRAVERGEGVGVRIGPVRAAIVAALGER